MSEFLSAERLQAIRDRAEKATPGPWIADSGEYVLRTDKPEFSWDGTVIAQAGREDFGLAREANIDFVAHARTDIPALLAEVEKRDAILAEVRGILRASSIPVGMTEAHFFQALIQQALQSACAVRPLSLHRLEGEGR